MGRYSVVAFFGLLMAFPLIYLISGSLMTMRELAFYPPAWLPSHPQWSNFAEAIEILGFRSIVNSMIFVVGVIGLQLALTLPAGFALAWIPFKTSRMLVALFLFPVLIPGTLTIIPTYIVTFHLGLVGTFPGMILPVAAGGSLGVLWFRQAFAGLPVGLIEAARIDGASWHQTFFRVALPLVRPAIAAYAVITFLAAWNLYIWPLVVAPGEETRVLSVALLKLAQTAYNYVPPTITFAAAVISVIPVLVVFVVFQKWFTRGLLGTGLD